MISVGSGPFMSDPDLSCRIRIFHVGYGPFLSDPDHSCRIRIFHVGSGPFLSDPDLSCQIRIFLVGFRIDVNMQTEMKKEIEIAKKKYFFGSGFKSFEKQFKNYN